MNDSRWVIFVAISRLVFARNLDITILELQNSICFPAVLGNIMLFDSDSLCYFCDSIPCRELDTLLAEMASHTREVLNGKGMLRTTNDYFAIVDTPGETKP